MTLDDRRKAFRAKYPITIKHPTTDWEDIIAEIEFAKNNPPEKYLNENNTSSWGPVQPETVWQAACDHILSLVKKEE